MKTINAIVMGPGEMTSEIVSNLFYEKQVQTGTQPNKNTKMVREIKNLQAETRLPELV